MDNTAFPGSSLLEKEPKKNLAAEFITPRCPDVFLDHDATYECTSTNPCTGCVFTCRRSPRLLTNGYYLLTEDSFLSDEDGNITLSPSQTSVTYKEKLVRIFRRRKRIRRSLVSLFNIGASKSWLNSTTIELPYGEDAWLDGDINFDAIQYYDNGTIDAALEYKAQRAERHNPASKKPSSSKDVACTKPRKEQHYSPPCTFSRTEEEYFYEKSLDSSKPFTGRHDLCPVITLSMCLIISLCIRFFLGGLLTTLQSFLLFIIILICSLAFLH
ncbi:transmembrane protein 71 isoform X2 [Rhineura floridana]|uniref:transmembrane protein 71 isoform X2 n=1 Tax=Rhineura floridana TaxID=261503 RepID=UPI002AC8562E|nr:transmembrane protein 71 isoform X2 [Rhineura floridana]